MSEELKEEFSSEGREFPAAAVGGQAEAKGFALSCARRASSQAINVKAARAKKWPLKGAVSTGYSSQ